VSFLLVAQRALTVPGWVKNALWRAAKATPSLDLPFAESKSLVDAITGRQLVTFARASSGTYVDSAGVLQTAATDVPRFDHNPLTGESLGLLVEEQRTNSIRNNTMVGAVAGTPGTLPTNWSGNATTAGITRQIVGTGIEDGINYIDYRIAGTTTAALFFQIAPELSTAVAATNGQTWTFSSYARLIAGSLAGFTQLNFYVVFNNSSGTGVQFVTGGIAPTSAALGTQRFTRVATASNATTAFVQPAFQFEALSGASVDITLRIGLPQLEQGATASSVIPTTTAAATRNADVAQITGTNFSSWYRQDEGTVFVSAGVQDFTQTNFPRLFSIDRGDISSNFIAAVRGSGTRRLDYSVFADGIGQAVGLNNGTAPAANTTVNGAWVYKANDFIGAVNGVLTNSDTSGSVPTLLTTFGVGMQGNATLHYNGTIKRLTFFPQRLPNSTLEAITR
jgi:hypothetical protein